MRPDIRYSILDQQNLQFTLQDYRRYRYRYTYKNNNIQFTYILLGLPVVFYILKNIDKIQYKYNTFVTSIASSGHNSSTFCLRYPDWTS